MYALIIFGSILVFIIECVKFIIENWLVILIIFGILCLIVYLCNKGEDKKEQEFMSNLPTHEKAVLPTPHIHQSDEEDNYWVENEDYEDEYDYGVVFDDSLLKFHSKQDTVEILNYKITNSLFYTTETSSPFPFVVDFSLESTLSSDNDYLYFSHKHYGKFDSKTRLEFLEWLAGTKKSLEVPSDYLEIYFEGLEYRAIVEELDRKEILFELLDLMSVSNRSHEPYNIYRAITYLVLNIPQFNEEEKARLNEFIVVKSEIFRRRGDLYALLETLNGEISEEVKQEQLIEYLIDNSSLRGTKKEVYRYYLEQQIPLLTKEEKYEIIIKVFYYMLPFYARTNEKRFFYNTIHSAKKLNKINNTSLRYISKIESSLIFSNIKNLTEIEKFMLLPNLLKNNINPPFISFTEIGIIKISDFLLKLNIQKEKNISIKQSNFIGEVCDYYGYNIEPDSRITNNNYTLSTHICIYKKINKTETTSNEYNKAYLLFDFICFILLELDELSIDSTDYIEQSIYKKFNLSANQKRRLEIHKKLILDIKEINIKEVTKGILHQDDSYYIKTLSNFSIKLLTDNIDNFKKSLPFITKLFRQIGINKDLFIRLLTEYNLDEELVIVQSSTKNKKSGSKIPKEQQNNIVLSLDEEKISAIQQETSKIQNTLRNIFEDEDNLEEHSQTLITNDNTSNINTKIQNIILELISKNEWKKKEILDLFTRHNTMLDSGVDEINEWTDTEFGDFLIEEENLIYSLNQDILAFVIERGAEWKR